MKDKITLSNVTSGFNEQGVINANFAKIAEYINSRSFSMDWKQGEFREIQDSLVLDGADVSGIDSLYCNKLYINGKLLGSDSVEIAQAYLEEMEDIAERVDASESVKSAVRTQPSDGMPPARGINYPKIQGHNAGIDAYATIANVRNEIKNYIKTVPFAAIPMSYSSTDMLSDAPGVQITLNRGIAQLTGNMLTIHGVLSWTTDGSSPGLISSPMVIGGIPFLEERKGRPGNDAIPAIGDAIVWQANTASGPAAQAARVTCSVHKGLLTFQTQEGDAIIGPGGISSPQQDTDFGWPYGPPVFWRIEGTVFYTVTALHDPLTSNMVEGIEDGTTQTFLGYSYV